MLTNQEMKKLGFAVVGTGRIANFHIDSIRSSDNAELKAIMSHDKARAEEFSRRYNIKAYTDIDELVKDDSIDVIDIASYHDVHAKYALKAINAGKNVIIEKPIGISLDNIDEIKELANRKNVKVTVIAQSRFDGALGNVKRMLENDELGKILFVNADIVNNELARNYEESAWKTSKERAGGGILIMKAIHLIDVLLWLFGDVDRVYGKIDTIKHKIEVEDTASALLKMKNGTLISLHATGSANYSHPFRIMIYGEKESLMVEAGKVIKINDANKGSNIVRRLSNKMPIKIHRSKSYKIGTINEQIKGFVSSIIDNNENKLLASVDDGKKALQVILAIYKSSKTGREINISKQ